MTRAPALGPASSPVWKTEIAAKHSLQLRTVEAVDQSGKDAAGNAVADLPGGDALLSAAFESDIGIENDPLPIADNGILWFEVTKVTAARDRALSEVRDRVVEAWKKDAVAKGLEERAKEIAAAHIGQGSSVTQRSQPASRSEPSLAAASRIARSSACAVGSDSSRVRLPAAATMAPSFTMIAPTGTSPRAPAARASSSARAMKSRLAIPTSSRARRRVLGGRHVGQE